MVGTVVFKNFETGSYREMKITAFQGKNYSDIGVGDFFSCRVNLSDRSIIYDFKSKEDITFHSMEEILLVAEKARLYLYKNPYVTIAEFCLNMDECIFRTVSFKCGVYEPPDIKTLFGDSAYYMLLGEFEGKSPLWMSVFCKGINFAVSRILNTSERFVSFSSKGVYLNLSLFKKRDLIGRVRGLKRILYIAKKCKEPLELKARNTVPVSVYDYRGTTAFDKLVYSLCNFECSMFNLFAELMSKARFRKERVEILFNCTRIGEAIKLTDELYPELLEFSESMYVYGYLEAKAHAASLDVKEVLFLGSVSGDAGKIALTAKASSVNSKLLSKLPCAPYFDSDGTAIWD